MEMLQFSAAQLMFMFFIFCNIGWVQESIIESIYHRRPINRGFLKGPYIPIYGLGGMLILIMCMPFSSNGFSVYFVGMMSCTTLEYFVGWLMERVFHKQFWDYSMLRITYKNRISLLSSLFWGLMALFMVYVLFGIVKAFVDLCDPNFILAYDIAMASAMFVDTIVSVSSQIAFREKLKKLPVDKAKKLMLDKFIQLGGAVAKRRERFANLLMRMKFDVEESDVDETFEGFELDVLEHDEAHNEEKTNEA